MGPKRVSKLKVAPTGRISVVPEVCETSEISETPGIAAKDTETLTVGRPRTRNDKKKTPTKKTPRKKTTKTRSKTKEPVEVPSESDDSEDQDLNECESNIMTILIK